MKRTKLYVILVKMLVLDVGVGHGDDDGKYNSGGPGDDLFPLGHSPKGSPTVEG